MNQVQQALEGLVANPFFASLLTNKLSSRDVPLMTQLSVTLLTQVTRLRPDPFVVLLNDEDGDGRAESVTLYIGRLAETARVDLVWSSEASAYEVKTE